MADTPPDVVLCDLAMPGLHGYEVAARLRAAAPPRPLLVAVTAFADEEVRRQARQAGFDHFFVKGARPAELLRLLRAYADRRHGTSPRPAC
jgi:CheY-like chemotaxis protein